MIADWKPIETAPEDECEIMVWTENRDPLVAGRDEHDGSWFDNYGITVWDPTYWDYLPEGPKP